MQILLTWDASRNDDHVSSCERLLHAVICWQVSFNLGYRGDVGEVGGDAWSVDDIVEGELVDFAGGLEEEGERLADA